MTLQVYSATNKQFIYSVNNILQHIMKKLLLPLSLLLTVSCHQINHQTYSILTSSNYYQNRLEHRMSYNDARKSSIELIKHFESFKSNRYKCPSGKITIGYGLTGKYLKGRQTIDKKTAEYELELIYDQIYSNIVDRLGRRLKENQMASLVSFAFNLGEQALYSSTMFNILKSGNNKIDNELTKFVYAKHPDTGKYIKLKGLELRRQSELILFNI